MAISIPDGTAANPINVTGGGGGGGGGTVTQGTAAAASAPWAVQLSQGNAAASSSNGVPVVIVDNSGHQAPTGDTAARAFFDKITDGTNTAAVKAASTAAAATDPALVVVESPNKPAVSVQASIGVVSAVLKSSAGNLRSVYAANRSAAGLWLQFQNQTTAITNAGNAVLQFYVPPNGQIVIGNDFFVDAGWAFSTGISWGFSQVTTTYTAYGTAANVDFQGTYL
jgi:hypothetical protein